MRRFRFLLPLLALATAVRCSDSGGPDLSGASFYNMTVDGAPWTPDTATGMFFYVQPDTGTLNLYATRVGATSTLSVSLSIRLPVAALNLPLADTGSVAVGTWFDDAPQPPGPPAQLPLFTSRGANPGQLHITLFRPADTVIAGNFSYVAALTPDTGGHHTVAGSFRVRYETQQVYVGPQ
ncbi:MAG: hypothetical protein U0133_17290 [Gemmatimonadales bacterium]